MFVAIMSFTDKEEHLMFKSKIGEFIQLIITRIQLYV